MLNLNLIKIVSDFSNNLKAVEKQLAYF